MGFFTGCATVAAAKSEYRRLAKLHHPDLGGDTRTMQQINDEYHRLLESLDGETRIGADNREHVYHYNREHEQAIMDKVNEVLALNLPSVTVEIVGWWVWVHGDTRPVKEQLKGAGFLWHSKRLKWYWRQRGSRKRKYTGLSFDHLRAAYGSETFTHDDDTRRPAMQPALIG